MIQMLYILFGMVIVLFILAIILTVLPDKKEKEEKPTNKTPIRVERFIHLDDYLYILYNDGTWEVVSRY